MTVYSPPPPSNLINKLGSNNYLRRLADSVRTIFAAIGGQDGVITMFRSTDTPTNSIGWETSSTVNMTAPDGYIKINVNGQDVVIPYWNT